MSEPRETATTGYTIYPSTRVACRCGAGFMDPKGQMPDVGHRYVCEQCRADIVVRLTVRVTATAKDPNP